jgi:hypothetical protein
MRAMTALLLTLAGCYSPKIADGDFSCAISNLCPDGFKCSDGVCRSSLMSSGGRATFAGSGALGASDLSNTTGMLVCNTETGAIRFVGKPINKTVVEASSPGFVRAAQANGPGVAMWNFEALVIPAGVTVLPDSQSRSIPVFLGHTSLDIQGNVDWRGYGGSGGSTNMQGAVVAGGGSPGASNGGGGGAGYGQAGHDGGGLGGGMGGASYGNADLAPILFGRGGGAGAGNAGGNGGAGGGAFVLLGASVDVGGTINVSGNQGNAPVAGSGLAGGGGGGSGGSIMIGGDKVTLRAGHNLIASGGAGATGTEGPDPMTQLQTAGGAGGDGAPGRIRVSTTSLQGTINASAEATLDDRLIAVFPR